MSSRSALSAGRVTVVGSLNLDRIWRVARLPRPGETLFATTTRQEFGGKGANQAVAAARHGATVALIGALGADADGRSYREHLARECIDTSWLAVIAEAPTGTAFICVDEAAENEIIVDRGANGRLSAAHTGAALTTLLPATDVLLVGLECPSDAVLAALRAAASAGVCCVFNPSPVATDFPWGEVEIDAVIVNEHECAEIFGTPEPAVLARHRIHRLIVTQGASPTLLVTARGILAVPAFPVEPRDTVGAGDTFAGVLAAQVAKGAEWPAAVIRANIAAALSTLAPGAQGAMPTRAAVEAALTARVAALGGERLLAPSA